MKKILKKLLLKIGSLLKLGIVNEEIYLIPFDYKVCKHQPHRLKAEVSIAYRHLQLFEGNATGFDEYIRRALAEKFVEHLAEHIDVRIVEDKPLDRVYVYGYLNILKDENRS